MRLNPGRALRDRYRCAILALGPVCLGASDAATTPEPPTPEALFALANSKNLRELERISRTPSVRASSLLTAASTVALFTASPAKYRDRFVAWFPQDGQGVMQELYGEIELKRLTPGFLFSFTELGRIARDGYSPAVAKLFGAVNASDGAVAELLCEEAVRVLRDRTTLAIRSIARLRTEERAKVYECLQVATPGIGRDALQNVMKTKTLNKREGGVVRELQKASAGEPQ
jgi:hypothetical protein